MLLPPRNTLAITPKVLDEHLELALDVLSDMFFNSKFSEKDINKEREVIIEEIKMYEDTPDEIIHDVFSQTIWEGHPLGKPVLGTEETISTFSKADFLNFIDTHYVPDNIVIALAGKVEHAKVIEVLEKLFGQAKKGIVHKYPLPPHNHSQIQNIYRDGRSSSNLFRVTRFASRSSQIYPLFILKQCFRREDLVLVWFKKCREERGLAYSV